MRNKLLLLLLLLLSAWGARAQTTLAQESFETDGNNGVRYTSNAFDLRTSVGNTSGAFPYFTRALTNPLVNPANPSFVSFGSNDYPVTIGNVTGSVFWAAEAVESSATNPASTDRPAGVVTLNAINASNYSGLTMTVALADARGPSSPIITQGGTNPQYEANDLIRLQYSTDGGATYNTIGQFLGNNSTGLGQGYMQLDLNRDGAITSADGAQSTTNTLDISLRDFSFSIPGSPAALLVRVQIDQRGASEELAFDNIRVTGVANTVAPPVLANIEGTAVSYLEGQAATQLTSALTVTNTTGNLTGATVTISNGRVSAQDVLNLPTTTGISSIYNSSTGVLTLTGPASAAAYQAALRTVTYQNNNPTNATAGTRTIQFMVANGSVTSGVESRNVVVTSALSAATTLPYQEEFTGDGEGTRYASNTFTSSTTGAAWLRTSANPYQTSATSQTPTTFSGISNSFYWYGNNTNSVVNPSRIGTLQTLPINTAGYVNLNFSLLLGASSGANASWQTADYFRVSYRVVGSSTWVPLIQFRGNTATVAAQGNLQRDADPNAAPGSAVPIGTTLTPALASFSAALPSSVYGQTLEFQAVQVSDDVRAELAFDNFQLTGTQVAAPTVTTAATSVTSTSAVLGGNVTADGGATVTARGIRYGTSPTLAGATQVVNGSGTGSFSATISGLNPGTTYYVAAYATNSVGTTQGTILSFTTAVPTIVVSPASLPAGTVGAAYSQTITAAGGTAPYTFAITSGALPAGLTLTSAGTLAGTPTAGGSFSFTVRATDASAGTYSGTQSYSLTVSPPIIVVAPATLPNGTQAVAYSQTLTASGGTAPYTFAVTAGALPSGLSLTLAGTLAGTPTASGSFTFTVAATDASTGGGPYSGTRSYTLTIVPPAATTVTLTQLTPTPTATATVTYRATFATGVTGLSISNFSVANASTTVTGPSVASVAAVSGSTTAYNVVVNTGTGNGTLVLQLVNSNGMTPTVSGLPASGPSYTIIKSFSAGPQLVLRAAGSASGANSDVTVFVDGVQVVQNGTSTTVANALQNGSFESNNLGTNDYLYPATGLVAAPWAFTSQAGVSLIGGPGFGAAASGLGSFVGFLQTTTNGNGTIAQSLAVPTGTYQVNFVAAQRSNQGTSDQVVNVFLNNGTTDVFVGTIQPTSTTTYASFTSAAFSVTAPALTATVSTTSASPTSTTPIPFSVTFSQSVGTTFTAADVTVTGGTLNTASFSGSGAGPYTFTVTPTATGSTVAVSLAANVTNDANNTANAASNTVSVQYQQAVTAAPVLTSPANGATTNGLPTFAGTAPAGSTVTIYLTPSGGTTQNLGTTTATGGSFSLTPATALASGTYAVYATAQSNGAAVSATSNTNTFTVDATAPTVVSINRQSPAASPTNATTLTYRITFSEAVTGVTSNDFSLTATGTAVGTASAVAVVSTSVYDVTVTSASGNGTLRLDLKSTGTGIADLATNAISGGYTSGQSYTLDNTAPTATISSSAGTSGGTTGTTPIPFTVTFSESVTGFSAAGITATNGTVGTVSGSGSGPYTFSVTPTTAGTATTITIAANAAQDAAGNGNAASAAYSLTYVAPVTATTWTGAISPDWFTAGNWTVGVPTATIDATVPNGTVFSPLINSGTASVRSLTLNSGATLSQSGGTLDVRGNLTSNGTFVPTGGTVVLGTTFQNNGPNILGSSRVRFWNLTVNANGVLLSTSAGASVRRLLTLNGAFVTQSNDFVLESDATGTAMVVNSNSAGFVFGLATVQRYIDASGNTGISGYRHYSSPVGGATVNSLTTSAYSGSFTAQVNAAYNTQDPNTLTLATYPNVFGYDESKIAASPAVSFSDFDKGYQSPTSLGDALTVGRGYAVQIGNNEKVQFTGPLNNNTQTINGLTYAASGTAGSASAGWALVGNPYPAPLDWRTVGNATGSSLNGVDGAAYVFQSTSAYSGRYTSFTNNVGAGTGLIAVGQGFFVRASTPGTTGSITLNNANRVTSYASPAFQRPTAETRPLLRLSLGLGSQPATVATAQDETFVYFEAGATAGFDGHYDAYKLANPSGYYLGSVTPGSAPLGLSIDGREPLAAATTTEIPLWVSLPAGTYSLTATELLNFATLAGGTTVQLRDALLGTLTNLATVPSYSFSVAANAAYAGRFSLVFRTSNVLATTAAQPSALASLYPNPIGIGQGDVTLAVTGLPASAAHLEATLLNALGQVVGHKALPAPASGAARVALPTTGLATGVYLVRLTGDGLPGGLTCRLTVE